MNQLVNTSKEITVTSVDISEVTGKAHKNVLADIRKMLIELEFLAADFSATRIVRGKDSEIFVLPKNLVMTLMSKYDFKVGYAMTQHIEKLEAVLNKPMTPMEMVLAQATAVVALEHKFAKDQAVNVHRLEILEDKLAKPLKGEVIPFGLLTVTGLQRNLLTTVSNAKLRELISIFGLTGHVYTIVGGEHLVPVTHYDYKDVENMMTKVVNSAVSVSAEYHTSHYLGNAKFKIIKR